LSPSLIGFVLIISNLEGFVIAGKHAKSYIRRTDVGRQGGDIKEARA